MWLVINKTWWDIPGEIPAQNIMFNVSREIMKIKQIKLHITGQSFEMCIRPFEDSIGEK